VNCSSPNDPLAIVDHKKIAFSSNIERFLNQIAMRSGQFCGKKCGSVARYRSMIRGWRMRVRRPCCQGEILPIEGITPRRNLPKMRRAFSR
jgi:hypothetical protein